MQNRQYQQVAIPYLAATYRGILQAPAGAGKTYIAATALHRCLKNREGVAKVQIVVNTIEQVEQMQSALDLYPGINARAIVKVSCAAAQPDCSDVDLLIVDECHRSGSPLWSGIIKQAKKARWGLSATPFSDDKERNDLIKDLFTDRIHIIERAQLVDDGHLTRAKVIWRNIVAPGVADKISELETFLIEKRKKKMPFMFRNEESARKQINQCRWQAAQQVGLWSNDWRDFAIISEANQRVANGEHVIVLIGNKDHGQRLQEAITGSVMVHSGVGKKARAYAIKSFRNGSLRCMVGTSAIEEGFDAPIASCIIMAGAGRSERKAIQSTGRVLRPFDGKECGLIIDFSDSFHPMLSRQAGKRRKIYNELSYSQK